MKPGIHPTYAIITANCTCGNVIKVNSTAGKDLHLDVCGACHPFYTGTQKVVDTGGRIAKFNNVSRKGAYGAFLLFVIRQFSLFRLFYISSWYDFTQ